jgi:hypothetical protein
MPEKELVLRIFRRKMKYQFRIIHAIVAMILIATTLLTTKVSFAQTGSAIYVNGSTGSNTNDGLTVSTPVKTIQQAITLAKAGYSIYVRAGTYNENLTVTKSGTSTAPITLTRYGSETVTINGGTGIALRASNGASYWVLDGLTFKSSNRYTLQLGFWGESTTNYWIVRNNTIKGANYIMGSYHLWENNNIDGTGYAGTSGDAGISDGSISHHNVYRGNTIHDFSHYNARGIWTQGLTHDSVIENNYVYNIVASSGLGQCIDLDGAGNVEWRHIVRGNTVVNCSYMGIQLENIFATTIENNVIRGGRAGIGIINYNSNVGCKAGGENNQYGDTNGDKNCKGDITNNIIRQNVITTSSYWGAGYGGILNWDAGGLKILGNTIYSPSSSSNAGINFQGTAANTKEGSIIGNIVMNGNGTAICAQDFASFSSISNNLTYRTNSSKSYGLGSGCSTTYSVAEFQSLTGKGQNSVFGDPLFTNASGYDLRPTSGSPSIDAGINLGTTIDIEGKTRPAGSTYDIGAYEFDGVAVAKTPTYTPTTSVTTVTPTVTATPVTSVTPTVEGTPVTTVTDVAPTTEVTPVITATSVSPTITSTPPVTKLSGKNVALGKPAKQINDYKSSLYGTAYASRAVDGNVDGIFADRSVSSTTANTSQAWWQVDLKYVYQLSEIKIWNRTDCCTTRLADFYILVSNKPFTSTNLQTTMKQYGVSSYYVKDTAGRPTTIALNRRGRYVRIQLRSSNNLSLAEVQVLDSSVMAQEVTPVPTTVATVVSPVADNTNVALGKTAKQSNNYTNTLYGVAYASRAIDGNTDGLFANLSVSSTTATSIQPYWEVDLQSSYPISEIKIWNRTDCCTTRLADFFVMVSDQPFSTTNLQTTLAQSGVSSYYVKDPAGTPTTIAINRTGRYVRIQLRGTNSLSLAEVQVFKGTLQQATVVSTATAVATITPTPTTVVTEMPTITPTVAATTLTTIEPTPTPETSPTAMIEPTIEPTQMPTVEVIEPTPTMTMEPTQTSVTVAPTAVENVVPPADATPDPDNAAKGKPASQSSTIDTAEAARAVDGNLDGVLANNSVSQTNADTDTWWQVDLEESISIDKIKIWTQTDADAAVLSDFYIFISDTPFTSTNLVDTVSQPGVTTYFISGSIERLAEVTINQSGRYIRIQLKNSNPLSLAEVEVIKKLSE